MEQKSLSKINRIFFIFPLLSPLLIYLGKRSLLAFDEGFYALQAKWILINNDWVSPMWWDQVSLDRTIAIPFLIALCQKIFGENTFSVYIPNITAGLIIIYLTYKTHEELIGKKYALVSPLILATTPLWINYYHMATQDIIFSAIVFSGVFACIKAFKSKKTFFYFYSSFWIGLGFMVKTYLVFIPLIALIPFLKRTEIYKKRIFLIGILLGFLPFILWTFKVINIYDFSTFNGIFEKLITLSKNNNFTNPFYYYLWNLPLNSLPWSLFSLIGIYKASKLNNNLSKFFLIKFPLLIIILLSLFSTKTPYYPIQILPLLSINAFLGIDYLLTSRNKIITYFKKSLFGLIPIILIIAVVFINLNNNLIEIENKEKIILSTSLILFSLSWILILIRAFYKKRLLLVILGPYLLTATIVQSGIICDRSSEIRIATELAINNNNLSEEKINVIKSNWGGEDALVKIIKISLNTPKIGNGVNKVEDLKNKEYAWKSFNKVENQEQKIYKIIYESEILFPWKLIKKN